MTGVIRDSPFRHAYEIQFTLFTLPRVLALGHCRPEENAQRLDICLVVLLCLNYSKAFSITSNFLFYCIFDCACCPDASVIKEPSYKIGTHFTEEGSRFDRSLWSALKSLKSKPKQSTEEAGLHQSKPWGTSKGSGIFAWICCISCLKCRVTLLRMQAGARSP